MCVCHHHVGDMTYPHICNVCTSKYVHGVKSIANPTIRLDSSNTISRHIRVNTGGQLLFSFSVLAPHPPFLLFCPGSSSVVDIKFEIEIHPICSRNLEMSQEERLVDRVYI